MTLYVDSCFVTFVAGFRGRRGPGYAHSRFASRSQCATFADAIRLPGITVGFGLTWLIKMVGAR